MFFIISGEGPSDVGCETNNPGPLLDALIVLAGEVSDLEFRYELISRSQISLNAKCSRESAKSIRMRGYKSNYPEHAMLFRFAEVLSRMALSKEDKDTGVVLFHDCDFTSAENNPDRYYKEQVASIESGFRSANFRNGVPMVPKTRSESWFLCHYQENPYSNCARFEALSGSDNSPKSGKKLLAAYFGCHESQIYERIHPDEIDWEQIDCPSFLFFKNRFQHVVERLSHVPTTMQESKTLMSGRVGQ